MITIKEIKTAAEIKQFVLFPWRIYKNDPNWVPPLIKGQCDFFNADKNPFYRHSKVMLLMAFRDGSPRFGEAGEPVGRLSVHENTLHVEKHHEQVGFFGFFESIDDFAVTKALFDYGKNWLENLGYEKMRGPANFSINGEYSLLVKGFDSPPVVLMTYNPWYYERLLKQYGFKTSQEMYAYQLYTETGIPNSVIKRAEEVEKNHPEFKVRKMKKANLDDEAKIVNKIYNEAWDENWGAVPFTDKEIMALAKELKMILDEDIAYIGEINGEPIGFSLSIPDANQALKAANGRLFPFGFLKMLWAKRKINGVRVLVMGILKKYRHHDFDKVFYKKTYEVGRNKGYLFAEASLINESNIPMRHVLEKLGARIYKTYRMYDLNF
ncbi:MAG: N-acetyltransferase [Patescibacteria group bacterium]